MNAYTHNMTESITYWPPGGNDGFGGTEFGMPVAAQARWQDVQQLFRDAQGRERVSESVVYIDQAVETGGYLYRGESVAADPIDGAKEIRQYGQSPSLDGDETLHKATL